MYVFYGMFLVDTVPTFRSLVIF